MYNYIQYNQAMLTDQDGSKGHILFGLIFYHDDNILNWKWVNYGTRSGKFNH